MQCFKTFVVFYFRRHNDRLEKRKLYKRKLLSTEWVLLSTVRNLKVLVSIPHMLLLKTKRNEDLLREQNLQTFEEKLEVSEIRPIYIYLCD